MRGRHGRLALLLLGHWVLEVHVVGWHVCYHAGAVLWIAKTATTQQTASSRLRKYSCHGAVDVIVMRIGKC